MTYWSRNSFISFGLGSFLGLKGLSLDAGLVLPSVSSTISYACLAHSSQMYPCRPVIISRHSSSPRPQKEQMRLLRAVISACVLIRCLSCHTPWPHQPTSNSHGRNPAILFRTRCENDWQ